MSVTCLSQNTLGSFLKPIFTVLLIAPGLMGGSGLWAMYYASFVIGYAVFRYRKYLILHTNFTKT